MSGHTPTQADREAAASNILRRLKFTHGGEQPWMDASTQSMRMGEQDDHWEVQAFAAHRIAACNSHGELVSALEKSAVALEEASKLLFAKGLQGCASIMMGHRDIALAAVSKAKGEAL